MTGQAARRGPVRPARRHVILGTMALVTAGLVLVVQGVEMLRHPAPGGSAAMQPSSDPREVEDCPRVVPRDPWVLSNDLLDCPDVFDGMHVRYRGEVIGGVLSRSHGAWVQVNDDVYADTAGPLPAHRDYQGGNAGIGVLVPEQLVDAITRVGGPHDHGDLIEVTGTFHKVAPGHLEVAVIIADDGRIVRPGMPFRDVHLPDRVLAAAVLASLALTLVSADLLLTRRRQTRL